MEPQSSKRESLTVGYVWSFGATALPLVSIFIASLIIARWMGPQVVGLISWTMALATVFLIVGKFGVEGAASRLISEYQVSDQPLIPRLVRSSVILRLIFTVPVAIAATVFAPQLAGFFGEESLLPLFRMSGILIFATSFNELAALLVLGLKRFRLIFVMRAVMLALRVALVIVAALFAMGPAGVLGAYILAVLVPGIAVLCILLNIKPVEAPTVDRGIIFKRLLRLSAPLAVSGASVTIYSLLDKLMLGYFGGASQVGYYSMARSIVETSLFPTFALIMTLRPALAGAYTSGDTARCSNLVSRSIKNAFVYSACVVTVFACLARPLITGLFTERFALSAELLILFLPLVVMRSLGAVILPGLIAGERAGTYARLTLIGAVVNFILNILLIPVWKAKGAVVATLISYLPIEVLGLRALARVIPGFWPMENTLRALKIIIAGSCLILVHKMFVPTPGSLTGTIVQAVAITIIFGVSLLALRALSFDEINDLLRPFLKPGRR